MRSPSLSLAKILAINCTQHHVVAVGKFSNRIRMGLKRGDLTNFTLMSQAFNLPDPVHLKLRDPSYR